MDRLDDFRIYYNHTIYPELIRLERYRIRLIRLIFFSSLMGIALLIVEMYLSILVVALVLTLPVVVYISYLTYRIQRFRQTFKPQIMNLILDFMNGLPNYSNLKYDPKKKLEKDQFFKSGIFETSAVYYEGEDFISGMVGEMEFELCELAVREISPVSNKLTEVFEGVFLYAIFGEDAEGSIVVWPRKKRQYLTRSIKAYNWRGGENMDDEILNEQFREKFLVYATEDTHVVGILSEPMQEALVKYTEKTGKDIYLSFHNKEIYAGITEPRDLMEPFLLRSNLSFELVREFYLDIALALRIVRDFDQTH
ncbi:MAG: hypothetical protein DHS20C18_31530 [Saprospiraceae bacterium]|nr:MAG: hypothetical protein DHS20C18_31530 [Saprospiraceae bacterium]